MREEHEEEAPAVGDWSEGFFDHVNQRRASNDFSLMIDLHLDAPELVLDVLVVFRESSKPRQNCKCVRPLSFGHEKSRGFRRVERTKAPNHRGDNLKGGWKLPLQVRPCEAFRYAVVEEEAEHDAKLLAARVL